MKKKLKSGASPSRSRSSEPRYETRLDPEVEAVADITPRLLEACLKDHARFVDFEKVRERGVAFVSQCPFGGHQIITMTTRYQKRGNTFITFVSFD